jgi:hypothetical protein
VLGVAEQDDLSWEDLKDEERDLVLRVATVLRRLGPLPGGVGGQRLVAGPLQDRLKGKS